MKRLARFALGVLSLTCALNAGQQSEFYGTALAVIVWSVAALAFVGLATAI